jgi:hypothetical protein
MQCRSNWGVEEAKNIIILMLRNYFLSTRRKKKQKPTKIPLYQDVPRLAKLHHCVGSFTGFAHLNSKLCRRR